MVRRIQSPGIEVNEIDRSQYNNKPDYSLNNAPACFMCGFADKGPNYVPQWINTKSNLLETFGAPTNEFETYMYNAGVNVLAQGGVLYMSKIPYENASKDNYTYAKYKVQKLTDLSSIESAITSADSSLTSFLEITHTDSGLLTNDQYDKLATNTSLETKDSIIIVNTTHNEYTDIDSQNPDIKNHGVNGIIPVIVTPEHAMFYQELIPQFLSDDYDQLQTIEMIKTKHSSSREYSGTTLNDLFVEKVNIDNATLSTVGSTVFDYTTMSRNIAGLFPIINSTVLSISNDPVTGQPEISSTFDPTYLKSIGIVVLSAFKDEADGTLINYSILESFVGSLDKNARTSSGSSQFIDNIVNAQSEYIRVFSGVNATQLKDASMLVSHHNTAVSLGFYHDECNKTISYKSFINSLNTVFNLVSNPDVIDFDLVLDAGISNIGALIKTCGDETVTFGGNTTRISDIQMSNPESTINNQRGPWSAVLTKFNTLCANTRRDCMLIADGLRSFCVNGESKIVRTTDPNTSVSKDILPNLGKLNALNSNYAAGYCDWFQAADDYSGDAFWCPPSIKVVQNYIYTDTYNHPWDAPAGLSRGVVQSAIDVAFSPRPEEAGKIYTAGWNYAMSYPLDGIIIEGQKTFQRQPTALDRVNVRRLMLYLEKRVKRIARYFVYEGNTEYLRQKFVDSITGIFEDAKTGNGIIDYAIKCDDELNTPQVIDNNELRCRIAVKPVKTTEFIVLDFITTNQSASVSEEVLR